MVIDGFLEDVRGDQTLALWERFFLFEAAVDIFPFVCKLLSKDCLILLASSLWPHAQRSRGASVVLEHGLRGTGWVLLSLRVIQLVVIA